MKRTQFTFYDSFYNGINLLPKYKQLEAYNNLIRYALFQEEPKNWKDFWRRCLSCRSQPLILQGERPLPGPKAAKQIRSNARNPGSFNPACKQE